MYVDDLSVLNLNKINTPNEKLVGSSTEILQCLRIEKFNVGLCPIMNSDCVMKTTKWTGG